MGKDCTEHAAHQHVHGPGCGHVGIVHEGHIDFLHDGHLHHPHGDHVDDHVIAVDAEHPAACDGGSHAVHRARARPRPRSRLRPRGRSPR